MQTDALRIMPQPAEWMVHGQRPQKSIPMSVSIPMPNFSVKITPMMPARRP